ncbi:hypothetical protein ROZALSC1DRAFT_28780 [Rozella allomycis CSF55]|uniref:Uncharacterized protein n=1 Tax=Rozella allomycis (strain CSF55) TaxID=988480 RepID=A0A4P9YJ70_ROZAC|nr:hypothetical protein ROZALSC1DRAFT_28780 [Rozella allomycis CSF55]
MLIVMVPDPYKLGPDTGYEFSEDEMRNVCRYHFETLEKYESMTFDLDAIKCAFVVTPIPKISGQLSMVDFEFPGAFEKANNLLEQMTSPVNLLVNVSGSGKTRRAFDILRQNFGLYIDISNEHCDFQVLIEWLIGLNQNDPSLLELHFYHGLFTLIKIRETFLGLLLDSNTNHGPSDWLDFQRSRHCCKKMAKALSDVLYKGKITKHFEIRFCKVIVFDEVDLSLSILPHRFNATGRFDTVRSLYYALCRCALKISDRCRLLFCGTAFSLRQVSLSKSAVGAVCDATKDSYIGCVFNVDFYNENDVKNFICLVFAKEAFDRGLLEALGRVFIGRPRFVATYVVLLYKDIAYRHVSQTQFSKTAREIAHWYIDAICCPHQNPSMPVNIHDYSLYSFWCRFMPDDYFPTGQNGVFVPFFNKDIFFVDALNELVDFITRSAVALGEGKRHVVLVDSIYAEISSHLLFLENNGGYMAEYMAVFSGFNFLKSLMALSDNPRASFDILSSFSNIFASKDFIKYSATYRGKLLEYVLGLRLIGMFSGEAVCDLDILKRIPKDSIPPGIQHFRLVGATNIKIGDSNRDVDMYDYVKIHFHQQCDSVYFPSVFAGPDVILFPFFFALKILWKVGEAVPAQMSKSNFLSLRSDLTFATNRDSESPNLHALGFKKKLMKGTIKIHLELPYKGLDKDYEMFENDLHIWLDLRNDETVTLLGDKIVKAFKKFHQIDKQ